MRRIQLSLAVLLLAVASPATADDVVSEEESQRYFFSLMQKGQHFRVHPKAAANYLRGVWRLDRNAHVGAGHYTRADQGDDVVLFCNDERVLQIDFSRNHDRFIEFEEQLSRLTAGRDGAFNFGNEKWHIKPLGDNHIVITRYDYIVVLERVSGAPKNEPQTAFPVE
ncbi:MAG: hypothetical protein QNJ19_06535 [Woeseiaceae bacterium]|nr:hypothetical protein [Woeseiaceae bacterium]